MYSILLGTHLRTIRTLEYLSLARMSRKTINNHKSILQIKDIMTLIIYTAFKNQSVSQNRYNILCLPTKSSLQCEKNKYTN